MPVIADTVPPELRGVTITRTFAAPRALVFRMWTDPAHVAVWFGPEVFTNGRVELDPRPGGRIHIDMIAPDGGVYPCKGEFRSLDEPRQLVMRTYVDDPAGGVLFEVEETVRFEEAGDRTVMHFHAEVIQARPGAELYLAGMEEGWDGSFNKLDAHIAA